MNKQLVKKLFDYAYSGISDSEFNGRLNFLQQFNTTNYFIYFKNLKVDGVELEKYYQSYKNGLDMNTIRSNMKHLASYTKRAYRTNKKKLHDSHSDKSTNYESGEEEHPNHPKGHTKESDFTINFD